MRSHKTGGLLTQVHYSEKCAFGGLKGWSLNTGGLKDRLDCIYILMQTNGASEQTPELTCLHVRPLSKLEGVSVEGEVEKW